jgi:geranylgeranyl transferase type-1 subunit beta
MSTPAQPALDKGKHVRYWLRCIKTCLPPDYTSTDLNRMTLGCFCVAALDVLGELRQATTPEQRQHWADWIYRNQLSTGGFRGSPATDFGEFTTRTNSVWDPANLSASFFALSALVNLGDDLSRVKRTELLELLPRLQRSDGSFGELLLRGGEDGGADKIVGGTDMRFVYMACALRWMLRGKDGEGCEDVQDFDVDKTVRYVLSARNYDGAFSDKEFGESNGERSLPLMSLQAPKSPKLIQGMG